MCCRGVDDMKPSLEDVDVDALSAEAAKVIAGSTAAQPEPPADAPPLPAAAAAADSSDDDWGVGTSGGTAAKIDYKGAGSYMI